MRLRPVLVAVSAFLLTPSVCGAIKLEDVLTRLASADETARFSAALFLIRHEDPKVPEAVPQALELEPIRSAVQKSKQGRAAADFVLWKLAGKPVAPKDSTTPRGANLILVSIDTLRADHLGCYSYGSDTSPTIDALAARPGRAVGLRQGIRRLPELRLAGRGADSACLHFPWADLCAEFSSLTFWRDPIAAAACAWWQRSRTRAWSQGFSSTSVSQSFCRAQRRRAPPSGYRAGPTE
jgi:hypothetical protein